MGARPKFLFVANTAWYLYNFRRPLIRRVEEAGYEAVLVSPRDAYVDRLEAEGLRWVELPMVRASINPVREAATLGRLVSIYRRERPAGAHHFTIKCVLYGTMAAAAADVGVVVNAITGLGHAFVDGGGVPAWRVG